MTEEKVENMEKLNKNNIRVALSYPRFHLYCVALIGRTEERRGIGVEGNNWGIYVQYAKFVHLDLKYAF